MPRSEESGDRRFEKRVEAIRSPDCIRDVTDSARVNLPERTPGHNLRMNAFEETVTLGSRHATKSLTVDQPRVLVVVPGALSREESVRKTCTLVENLSREGWEARLELCGYQSATGNRHRFEIDRPISGSFYCRHLIRTMSGFDIVHLVADSPACFWLFTVPLVILSRFFGKKTILSFNLVTVEDFLERWGWLAYPFFRMFDGLLVDGNYLIPVLERIGLRASSIATPFDPSGLECRQAVPVQPRILTVQPLETANNVACLIRAFKFVKQKYPRSELIITGDGSQRQALERLVVSENIGGVSFVHGLSRHEKVELYRKTDVYVNSSSVDGMPESILKAFAAGIPVVTTDAGGIPYLVRDRVNGLVVPVNNHVALAERVIELVEKPDLVRALAERGRASLERFHWSVVGRSWRQYYRSLIAN